MIRDKEVITKTTKVLLYLLMAKGLAKERLAYPSMQKALYPEYYKYHADRRFEYLLRRLYKQGWLKTELKETKRIISLTSKGELEALFQKVRLQPTPKHWDGKWRIVMFDIPEGARSVRDKLRNLLHSFGFFPLQASVYVYPYALSQNAVVLLKKSGLFRYIRIAKAEFDNDSDLRKQFDI